MSIMYGRTVNFIIKGRYLREKQLKNIEFVLINTRKSSTIF